MRLHARKQLAFLVLALCVCVSTSGRVAAYDAAAGTPKIIVGSMTIPFAYEKGGTGVYNQIFDQMIAGYQGVIDVTFYPSNRLSRAIEHRQIDCMYIAADTIAAERPEGSPYRDLEFIGPVNTISVVVYLQQSTPDVARIEQLDQMQIASDVNLVPFINELGIKEAFNLQSQLQMIEMLVAGRVDALIGYDFDLDFLTRKQGVKDKLKKASIRLNTLDDGIACFKNEKTAAFRTHLRNQLRVITDSGWLDDALKDYR